MDTSFQPLGIGVGSLVNGRYELVRKLGSGAMSAVFQVADHALNRDIIALKLFSPSINNDQTLIERIHNEVIITRKLNAPNIVRTYDFGKTKEGLYFMTMEYIEGVTLDKLVHRSDRPAPSFRDMIRILRDLATGMGHAHQHGIVHRDLKPANIIINLDGDVKIADFGLARALNHSHDLTKAGECVGTPYYMAPEQIQDQGVDGRTDVYALGIIAFELVMGTVPFDDKNWFHLARQIISQPLPEFDPYVRAPKWYTDFVRKAAAKRPEDRFQSAEEVQGYLSERLERNDFGDVQSTDARLSKVLSNLGKSLARYKPGVGHNISATQILMFGILMLGLVTLILLTIPGGDVKKQFEQNLEKGTIAISETNELVKNVRDVMELAVEQQKLKGQKAADGSAPKSDPAAAEKPKDEAAPDESAVKPDVLEGDK